MTGTIESAFHDQMLEIYRRARDECRYNATRFLQLVNERGGLQAAKDLLHNEGYSEGLTALWELGRLDISMEALVIQEPWPKLFTAEELAIAHRRLQGAWVRTLNRVVSRAHVKDSGGQLPTLSTTTIL